MTLVDINEINIPFSGIYVEDNNCDSVNAIVESWKYLLRETLGDSVATLFQNTFENWTNSDYDYELGYEQGYKDAEKENQDKNDV